MVMKGANNYPEWEENTDEVDFQSYMVALQSYILAEMLPDICIKDELKNFTSYSICSLLNSTFLK